MKAQEDRGSGHLCPALSLLFSTVHQSPASGRFITATGKRTEADIPETLNKVCFIGQS